MGRLIKKICDYCSRSFDGKPSHRFCSPRCGYDNRRKQRPEKSCEQCGNIFKLESNGISHSKQKYCSVTCSQLGRIRINEKTCPICGTRFRKRDAVYCSMKCSNESGTKGKVKKTCSLCGVEYTSVVNSLCCGSCRTIGIYSHECRNCNVHFRSNSKSKKYCINCSHAHLRGKTRPQEVKNRVREGYEKFRNSDRAKMIYARVGRINSEKLKLYYSTPDGKETKTRIGKKLSKIMKQKILNGEFTPNITNSFTHWTAEVEYEGSIRKFRSSWEACFWLSNPHLQYETIRVSLSTGGCAITDFVDTEKRIIYEIKPVSFWKKQQNKIDAIIEFCLQNDYKFIWISERNIHDYIKQDQFTTEFNKKQLEALLNGTKKYIN